MSKLKSLQPVEEQNEFLDIDENVSDDGVDDQKHEKLLEAISKLGKNKKLKIAQRTEPVSKISEHALVQIGSGQKSFKSKKIDVDELINVVSKKPKLSTLRKDIKQVGKRAQTLSAPLNTPQALRVVRAAGYEKIKEEITKWEGVVKGNREAEQLIFPLDQPTLKLGSAKEFTSKFKPKTPLEQQISELLRGNKHVQEENQELTPAEEEAMKSMSLKEALERRKELAKSRALQSYQEAKARRQNKIKSKTYHRLLKRDKMKSHVKEFEAMKDLDPESALFKLEQLDKKRIEERMTLKHKGAGKWAKLQAIRSKYDLNARESLADQLRIGKEVTRKVKKPDDESDEEIPPLPLEKSDNPWLGGSASESSKRATEITSGYRKLWNNVNESKEVKKRMMEDVSEVLSQAKEVNGSESVNGSRNIIERKQTNERVAGDVSEVSNKPYKMNGSKNIQGNKKANKRMRGNTSQVTIQPKMVNGFIVTKITPKNRPMVNKVEDHNIEEMPEEFSEELDEGLVRRTTLKDYDNMPTINAKESEEIFQIRQQSQKEIDALKNYRQNEPQVTTDIDPNKFVLMQETVITDSSVPEMEERDEEDDVEDERRMTLAEAFAEDDVIEEFREEKKRIVDASAPKDIDLTLPGWGEWGGTGLKISNRKKRMFIIKAPNAPIRKDANKGNLIINEDTNTIMRQQKVSNLPFGFTSTAAFESTIRAPVTSTFIPETAARKLAAPKVITKMGTIIAPMSDEVIASTDNVTKPRVRIAKQSYNKKRKESDLVSTQSKQALQKVEKISRKPTSKSVKL